MTEKERMLAGKLYRWDEELTQAHARKDELVAQIHSAPAAQRKALFQQHFGHIGEGFHIELPFQCDYGSNIHIG